MNGRTRTAIACALLATGSASAGPCKRHLLDAAFASGVSADRLHSVMIAESGGRPTAVSSAGAMGCMQLMPGTWQELTAKYDLGRDPFDTRANMIGGALYLGEMIKRYGWPDALAAYHAGPGRLDQMLHAGRPLPSATIAYMSAIGERSSAATVAIRSAHIAEPDWRSAGIFVAIRTRSGGAPALEFGSSSTVKP
jgi:soluble lytic murein transglycosylase-like protein